MKTITIAAQGMLTLAASTVIAATIAAAVLAGLGIYSLGAAIMGLRSRPRTGQGR